MKKAIAICRVSTKDQKLNNHSLEQQNSSVSQMADELSAEIVKIWAMAISSKKGNNLTRKDLNEALMYCRYNRSVKYLLIDKVSRFARELKMIFYFMVEFEKLGVKVVYCDPHQQKFNADAADAMYELAKKAHQAEAENEEKAETSITKMQARVALGYYPFYPHQGYMKTDLMDGLHVPDPLRFDLLRKALKDIACFDKTPEEALKWLYASGYRTPIIFRKDENGNRIQKGNRKLDMNHFREILKDPYYAGILRVGRWPENKNGLHQPMISEEEWEINVAIITNKPLRNKLKFNPSFPLNKAKHLPCVDRHGKGKLTGINHTNGKGWYREEYLCRDCRKRVPKSEVHSSLNDILGRTKPSSDAMTELIRAMDKVWRNKEAYRIQHTQELSRRKDDLAQQKRELILSLSAHPDLAEDIREEIQTIKLQMIEADRQIAEMSNVHEEYADFVKYALNYTEDLRSKFWSLPAKSFFECKQLLFKDDILVAQNGKVYTPNISLIYTLMEAKSSPKAASNANMVELAGTNSY